MSCLVGVTLFASFFIRHRVIAFQESQTNQFGYVGLNANSSSQEGNNGNLTLKYKAKIYLFSTRGGNFSKGIFF